MKRAQILIRLESELMGMNNPRENVALVLTKDNDNVEKSLKATGEETPYLDLQ